MNAINSVQLFLLVWTFTAVCRADDDLSSVSCKNVTGTVGKEVNLTCSVSLQRSECCIINNKFLYTEGYKKSEICRQDLPKGSCEQRNNFTCRYTPTTAVPKQFTFFVQTTCGKKNPEFTVDITEHHELKAEEDPGSEESPGSNGTVIAAVVGCFIIIIIIIITIIYKTQSNYSNPCGFQRRMSPGLSDDDDNSNFQQQSPQNVV